jgi:hypothetical protein
MIRTCNHCPRTPNGTPISIGGRGPPSQTDEKGAHRYGPHSRNFFLAAGNFRRKSQDDRKTPPRE